MKLREILLNAANAIGLEFIDLDAACAIVYTELSPIHDSVEKFLRSTDGALYLRQRFGYTPSLPFTSHLSVQAPLRVVLGGNIREEL